MNLAERLRVNAIDVLAASLLDSNQLRPTQDSQML